MARSRARHRAPSLLGELAGVVVPVACPGCARPDDRLCAGCAAPFAAAPVRREAGAPRLDRMTGPPLPVWAPAAYAGAVPGVVLAWKDRGRADLTEPLASALAGTGRTLAPLLAAAVPGPLRVVGVPTTPAARRRRGQDLVGALTDAVATGLAEGGAPAAAVAALSRRTGRDQVGRSARDRRAVGVRLARGEDPAGRWYLLVDDVLTTGATLAACEDALTRAGGLVVGAVVLAATSSPRDVPPAGPVPLGPDSD